MTSISPLAALTHARAQVPLQDVSVPVAPLRHAVVKLPPPAPTADEGSQVGLNVDALVVRSAREMTTVSTILSSSAEKSIHLSGTIGVTEMWGRRHEAVLKYLECSTSGLDHTQTKINIFVNSKMKQGTVEEETLDIQDTREHPEWRKNERVVLVYF